ncbi:efflux RND transporter periplasmic adaptor subunit [Agrobacterium tumefaciens]|uniref:efflux RND transporter periplasmic adaptor subunit n=1 Tax=Agrobacterium tumefaciens TaxID=358 RepID=UPI0021D1880E|nr:HlyD family efflux transporter periplasmic adaptor subunit [Agrobacterium tumefaciens]
MEREIKATAASSQRITTDAGQAASRAYELLLRIEAEARHVETVGELAFLIANETIHIAKCRQVFVLAGSEKNLAVKAATSVSGIDRNSPRIRWIEAIVSNLRNDRGLKDVCDFALPAFCPLNDEEHKTYPSRFMAWLPFQLRDGTVFGGMLIAREVPWNEPELTIPRRLAATYSHAWAALSGKRRLKRRVRMKPLLGAALIAAIALGFYPVPLTVLAPVEVAPISPRIIAAPMDGVIESIIVNPNQMVRQGEPLLKMSDVMLRNELAVAEQDVRVAEAKLMQVTQGAVSDPKLRADLAITRSELTVAAAKRNYAGDMLERSDVRAPSDGIAIYTDRRDWIGRPVTTGERIMEVADPTRMQLRIDVPVADAIAVSKGAKVRAFLDSDPLKPAKATVEAVSFEARMVEGDVLAYRIYAALDGDKPGMRLGIRGTAQISGDKVALAYYLFRKPISVIRQRFGL